MRVRIRVLKLSPERKSGSARLNILIEAMANFYTAVVKEETLKVREPRNVEKSNCPITV